MSTTVNYAAPTHRQSGIPLGIMMFLQYSVWGVWLPPLANYLGKPPAEGGLGFSQGQIGGILGLAGAFGAVTAPFIAGQVADRILNAERALAILLFVGGIVAIGNASATAYFPFLILAVAYSILYMPTLSLTNSIAFQNLDNSEKRFPMVRLWGTVGWIVAANAFSLLWLNTGDPIKNTARIPDALRISGIVSMAYAIFALFMLPKTPPKKSAAPLAFAKAFGLLKNPSLLVLTIVALPIAMIHQTYFFRMGLFLEKGIGLDLKYLGPVTTLGQVSEIVFLLALPFLLKRLGYKGVLMLGTAAYAARFAIFAIGHPTPLVIVSQGLHGLCYGCFFAGSFLFVEQLAPKDIRHSAQTVFGIVILGLGPIMALFYNQYVDSFASAIGLQGGFAGFWWVQGGVGAVCFGIIAVAFWPRAFPAAASVPTETAPPAAEPV